jgi:hypothetical protein
VEADSVTGWIEKKRGSAEQRIAGLRLTVHHYFGCGSAYFATCFELGINKADLHTVDLTTAKNRAVCLAQLTASRLYEATKRLQP